MKKWLVKGILSGIGVASIIALFDYYFHDLFIARKFIFNFLIFSIILSFSHRWQYNNERKK